VHILFFTDNFPPEVNAAATRVFERACHWTKWGHKVTVMTCAPNFPKGELYPPYKNRWYQVEEMNGIRVVRVKTYITANEGVVRRVLDFLSFMVMSFVFGLFQPRPDVVVSTSPQLFCAAGAWALSKARRLPYVFELSDLWPRQIVELEVLKPSLALRWIERIELFLYRQAKQVIALAPSFREDLINRGIPGEKIDVVINGVDLDRYSPAARDETLAAAHGVGGKFVVGYIGTHGPSQGLENLIDAAELVKECDQIVFLMVGAGAARKLLIEEAQKHGLSNIVFVESQPKSAMPSWWSICDVALIHLRNVPLFGTVIPSKMFEAMGMGLPLLVASPKGEASAIVEREGVGLWVPAGKPDELAITVRRLSQEPRLVQEFARRSLAAAPNYTRERQAQRFIMVLERVVHGESPVLAESQIRSTNQ